MNARTRETHPLTWRLDHEQPMTAIAAYEALDGYAAVRQALPGIEPTALTQLVKDSNLRGRGGAGFPTGVKWSLVPMGADAGTKYLLCNADEMEPGTFKDRLLLEQLPHQLIESMILAAWAIQATRGYIFLRGEYVLATERLQRALAEARERGYLGQNILGTGWDFDLFVHTGAGRYICGEETALINSLEGRRANPRAKPPFPQIAGAWGRPTIVNNVETLCNLPEIVLQGAQWYTGLSRSRSSDSGTKLYGASGRVRRPGLWELPIGTSAREILEEHAGGMQPGLELKAWLPGGASTDFLLPEHLDLAMDYDTIAKARSRLGTGLIMVVDRSQPIVPVVRNLEEFFARESCGWCTPCRDGLPWSVKLLRAIERGEGRPGDIEILEDMTRHLGPGRTYCALAPGAVEPLQSALRFFRSEFESGIHAPAASKGTV
ncbi:MAG TPA: NADH-quinone oxidoreductase subunit NuoF [Pseudomonadales bacterium]|nr:NADH-quinone oxidoreductase subunit NuoF [Pseudomonadales bacterium]HNC68852.1 NADH-quinone oxidoreductase subunit NuoF [Pseudomonadales bacterium]